MENKIKSFILALLALSATSLCAADFEITGFGAKAGGLNTAAIQAAIDAAAKDGGRVVVPAGVFVSGTLYMKSGVELHLEKGAVLKASGNLADYNQDQVYPENHGSVSEKWSNQQAAVLTGKIGIIISNNPQKRKKEKPSYDERSSTGKAGCGKSARPV